MPVTPVPGSEKFSYRPKPAAEIRRIASPHVRMHDITDAEIAAVDPLTYEVVRHRLESITDEMGEAIKRMSGSLIVTDTNDFDFDFDSTRPARRCSSACTTPSCARRWTWR